MALEDLYREVILDHYRSPRNRGELVSPPAIKAEGKNPVCGDELTIYLDLKDDVIVDVKISGSGCSISTAASSMMTTEIKGKSVSEARKLISDFKELMNIHESNLENAENSEDHQDHLEHNTVSLGELDALTGVVKFPVRVKCATLGFNTLKSALDSRDNPTAIPVTSTE